jgi:hypothetical protein
MTRLDVRIIPLGRYAVRLDKAGGRHLLCDGREWLQAQRDTLVWELIDRLLELEAREICPTIVD